MNHMLSDTSKLIPYQATNTQRHNEGYFFEFKVSNLQCLFSILFCILSFINRLLMSAAAATKWLGNRIKQQDWRNSSGSMGDVPKYDPI